MMSKKHVDWSNFVFDCTLTYVLKSWSDIWPQFLVACYATLPPALSCQSSVCPSVRRSITLYFFCGLWPHCSCPNDEVTSTMAPAHPHATGVVVYPALFILARHTPSICWTATPPRPFTRTLKTPKRTSPKNLRLPCANSIPTSADCTRSCILLRPPSLHRSSLKKTISTVARHQCWTQRVHGLVNAAPHVRSWRCVKASAPAGMRKMAGNYRWLIM